MHDLSYRLKLSGSRNLNEHHAVVSGGVRHQGHSLTLLFISYLNCFVFGLIGFDLDGHWDTNALTSRGLVLYSSF
jgi:hypothetical protein